MIKKTLITASVLVFAASVVSFADTIQTTVSPKTADTVSKPEPEFKKPHKGPDFAKRNAEFEKRLKLTDKQKEQAEQIRKQGFEKIKPVMEKIKEKRMEADAVKRSKIVDKDQKAKLEQLDKEIDALKREAHEIRMQNMKDFEAILTKKQKKELQKMKEEGRKKFDKEHRKPPFSPMTAD